MSTLLNNNDVAGTLYSEILAGLPTKTKLPSLLVVQHIVPNNLPLFRVLALKFSLSAIIPKPNSVHGGTKHILEEEPRKFPYHDITREELAKICDHNHGLPIPNDKKPFAILDVGGYFAPCAPLLRELYGSRFVGVVEDTENGHQRYERLYANGGTTDYPVYSVARSPLKEPEDFLVGQSIVYSVESILRENDSLLTNRQVLVIGYGKIGRSIAASLVVRNINVWVYDQDPIKRAQAMSHGFRVPQREFAITQAGLILGATGNKSLNQADFEKLGKYTYVASVTSADDEFDFGDIRSSYRVSNRPTTISVFQHKSENKVFNLIRSGNAVNFAHGNTLGVYIYLVACEILQCLRGLSTSPPPGPHSGIYELSTSDRQSIADSWIRKFGRELGS